MSRIKKDPLAWINEDDKKEDKPKPIEPITRKRPGPKRILDRDYEKSSQEGLRENWTRATFIVREDLLKTIKDYSINESITLKDIMVEAMADYINKIERGED